MYIHTSAFVSFETYPIFNNIFFDLVSVSVNVPLDFFITYTGIHNRFAVNDALRSTHTEQKRK